MFDIENYMRNYTKVSINKMKIGKIKFIIIFIIIGAVLLGCKSKTDEKNGRKHHIAIKNNSAQLFKKKKTDSNKSTLPGNSNTISELIEMDVVTFSDMLQYGLLIREILNFTNETFLTLEAVSNKVANVPTSAIVKVLQEEDYNRKGLTSKEKSRMLLWQVIYNRKKPAWASLFALSKFGDYYTYHGSKFPGKSEWIRDLRKKVKLSENPIEAEKKTFVSIKNDLMMDLVYEEPENGIKLIEEIRDMHKSGVIDFPEQPFQMLYLFKADALLGLNREDEAREEVQKLYNQLDSIDDSIIHSELDKGVDFFINRSKQIYPKIYPDFDPLALINNPQKPINNKNNN